MLKNMFCSTHIGVKNKLEDYLKLFENLVDLLFIRTLNFRKQELWMLENKFSSIPVYLEDDPKLLKFFELPLTKLMNVTKQVLYNSLCEDNLELFKN